MQNSAAPIKARILLIEDKEYIQRLIVSTLTKNGYEVIVAATGAEGLSLLPDSHAKVVIVDETLPDMDSLELARQIRSTEVKSSFFIVWLSNHPSHPSQQLLEAPVDCYLTKPFNPMELTQFLKRLLSAN